MTDNLTPDAQHHDDELAEFADRLLASDAPETLEMATKDQELLELQQTALRLERAFGSAQPDQAMAARIWANLKKEWRQHKRDSRASADSQWRRSFGFRRLARRQATAFALLAAVVAVVASILLLAPGAPTGDTLPGTAEGQSGLLPVIVLLGFALAGVLGWLAWRRGSR